MIIRNGNLHIGDGTIREKTDIRIEQGKIAEIGKNLRSDNETEIDATGMELFPGFIDPICGVGSMGIPTRYMDNGEVSHPLHPEMNIKYSVDPDELSNQEFYKSGITTVGLSPNNSNIMGGRVAVFKTPKMPFAQRMVQENGMLKCSVTSAVKDQYGEKGQLPMTKMGIFFMLEQIFSNVEHKKAEELNEKEKIVKEIMDGKVSVCVAAEKQSEMQAALHFFGERQIPVTLSDGYDFGKCLDEMKEQKANLILGNLSSLSQKTKHGMDLSLLQELIENGNLIAFSTTCGGWSEGREVLLWNAIDVYRAGIDAEEIVKMLTSNPAKILGLETKIGTLREGLDADISVYTGHPVKTYQARVAYSIVNGEVVYHE